MPGFENKPEWTEIRYRVRDPNQFPGKNFRRKTLTRGVVAIIGRLGPGKSKIQALRFKKTVFPTVSAARQWLKEHPVDSLDQKVRRLADWDQLKKAFAI